ncbi:glycosyltransferase [Bacillus sp. REN3]|uniref:MGDG synthase family glycosyltransferase n=1 Tax=Bacillus sp. REN3 TaxID=2802440 RepID=UPI0032C1145F
MMKKVLFLPLFQMESGHHRTSDALMEAFRQGCPDVRCEKMDFLSYAHPFLEKSISTLYLKWISVWPASYSWLYSSCFQKDRSFLHSLYETLFLEKMEQLLLEEKPDLIICTHSFSSFLIDKLKSFGISTAPVVNVYTDFFMNGVWGKMEIDLHLVPTIEMKEKLERDGVDGKRIKISGILTSDRYQKLKTAKKNDGLHVLVTGGSLGLGRNLDKLFHASGHKDVKYKVLCGFNKELFERVAALNAPNVVPLSYIPEAEQMNHLYHWADAIITKPGGITVGEAIRKMLPVFIHSVLPGQEERNMEYLVEKGLASSLDASGPIEEQLIAVLKDDSAMFTMKKARFQYTKNIEIPSCSQIAAFLSERYLPDSGNEQMKFIDDVFSKLFRSL